MRARYQLEIGWENFKSSGDSIRQWVIQGKKEAVRLIITPRKNPLTLEASQSDRLVLRRRRITMARTIRQGLSSHFAKKSFRATHKPKKNKASAPINRP
jgi:hypothetical protein